MPPGGAVTGVPRRGALPMLTVAVRPAAGGSRAWNSSMAIRTGTRCASRTQLKVGSTLARRFGLGARSRSSMPPAMLSTWPRIVRSSPISLHHRRRAGGDARQLGSFEIALDPEGAGVHQGEDRLAGGDVVAGPQFQVGHRVCSTGASTRDRSRSGAAPGRGRRRPAGRRRRPAAPPRPRVPLRLDLRRRSGRAGGQPLPSRLGRQGPDQRASAAAFGLAYRQLKRARSISNSRSPRCTTSVIAHLDRGDRAGDIGRDADHIGPHPPVPGPGGEHVVVQENREPTTAARATAMRVTATRPA